MENIETLLAAVAQTQGFDDDEPVASTGSAPRLENFKSSPEIGRDVGGSELVGAPRGVSGDARPSSVASPPPETTVPAMVQVIGTAEKRKRGRPPKGQLSAKPPPPKRKKEHAEEEEEEDVCFICFDGGSLVLCDRKGCPKAYHPSCIKRDEAFFKSKAKWNCGWHICSVCRKASYYMCYTCPYSLCKGCTKDADYVRVRGNKGFCNTCMKIIMLIENKDQASSDSAVQVDFDDVTSWEYLFKMYWVILKEKLSLTMKELTRARKPWKGVAPMVCKPQLSNVHHTAVDGNVSIPNSSSEHLAMCKLQEVHNDRMTAAQSACAEVGQILSKDGKNDNTDGPIITTNPDTYKPITEKAVINPSIKDAADKPRVDHVEMPKLLESHNLAKEDSHKRSSVTAGFIGSFESDMGVGGNNFDQLVGIKSSKQKTYKKYEERETQNNSSIYAAINVHNMNLIYLRRNMMENLIEDKHFLDKVVGSIVRIRISSDDQKPDVYRLVQVVGICKVAKPYKIGDKTADIMLEVLNLGMKEVVAVGAISNQEFTEAECRQLEQYIRCGLLKQYTIDEVQKKAMAIQSVRFNDWLEAEVLRLYHLLDQASKKGCEEEVSEYVRKIQLLKSPEEHQRRISEVPDVHAEIEMCPNLEPEDARSSGNTNSTKDDHVSPKRSGSAVSRNNPLSPIEQGKEEGPVEAQSKILENIDASGSHSLEKSLNQLDTSSSEIGGGDDQTAVRSELQTSTATASIANSLADDCIEIEKLWHYRDFNGKIQGPFSMMHLRISSTTGQFPPDMRIWTNHEQYDSLLLTDALKGKLHGASDLPHTLSPESIGYKAINENNGHSEQTHAARCINAFSSFDNNGGSTRADESSWPKCWDLFKDKSSGAQEAPSCSSIPSSSLGPISVAIDHVQECGEFNHVTGNTKNISSVPTRNEMTHQSQSSEENMIPLPIGLSLNDIESVSVCEPVSKSTSKQEVEIDLFNLPSPKHWGFSTAEKQQSESSSFPIQNSGFLELLSPKPRSDSEDQDSRAAEAQQSGPDASPSWSNNLNMMAGGVQFPEMANDWFGYSLSPAKQDDSIHPEGTSNTIVASDNNQFTHVSSPHPAPNISSWLAMLNEPIEFVALGEDSVSDLLAAVDAMESKQTSPSPTSATKFADELTQDCNDCFSSIEDFSHTPGPGKSDAFSSSGEMQLSGQSSVPSKPIGQSQIDALDSFSKSGVYSLGSSSGETSAPVYTGGSESHSAPPNNTSQDMVGVTVAPGSGPDLSDPGWGSVQGNINLVTVQGNVNLVLGGPTQGMANLGWGTSQGTWGNPNINHGPVNASLPWDGQRQYSGERFTSSRERGYQGVETGLGRGRPPWGRPPYGGGGGYSRALPKGQRICKFYESGHCKKDGKGLPQHRSPRPTNSNGEVFLIRFTRNANLVANGVAKNICKVGNQIKQSLDELSPYRRRPK